MMQTDLVLSGPPDNSADRYLLAQLFEQGAIVTEVAEGDQFDLGDYHLEVLWPLSPPISEPGNDSSVVTRFVPQEPKGLSLLGLGDLGEQAQQMLLPRLGADEVDIVKVSHHGSSDQLSTLYRDVSASVGLMGVGADNSYGHPAPETLQLLRSAGTLPLRSDERGTLTLRCGEDGIETWSAGGG
jgi:competence protein ComEC